jgi:hypothetical protein
MRPRPVREKREKGVPTLPTLKTPGPSRKGFLALAEACEPEEDSALIMVVGTLYAGLTPGERERLADEARTGDPLALTLLGLVEAAG